MGLDRYGQTDHGLVRSSNKEACLVDNRYRPWAGASYADRHPSFLWYGNDAGDGASDVSTSLPLLVLNSDDSRAYFLRAEHIRQLTRDHTLMDNYVRKGRLTREQVTHHPDHHVLTRTLGSKLSCRAILLLPMSSSAMYCCYLPTD